MPVKCCPFSGVFLLTEVVEQRAFCSFVVPQPVLPVVAGNKGFFIRNLGLKLELSKNPKMIGIWFVHPLELRFCKNSPKIFYHLLKFWFDSIYFILVGHEFES